MTLSLKVETTHVSNINKTFIEVNSFNIHQLEVNRNHSLQAGGGGEFIQNQKPFPAGRRRGWIYPKSFQVTILPHEPHPVHVAPRWAVVGEIPISSRFRESLVEKVIASCHRALWIHFLFLYLSLWVRNAMCFFGRVGHQPVSHMTFL